MKTRIITEIPAITLQGDSYNGGRDEDVTWAMLHQSEVGQEWNSSNNNCGRGSLVQLLKVISIDENGVTCLLKTEITPDVPEICPRKYSSEFIHFEFHNGIRWN